MLPGVILQCILSEEHVTPGGIRGNTHFHEFGSDRNALVSAAKLPSLTGSDVTCPTFTYVGNVIRHTGPVGNLHSSS
jgi:hypothetical protein